ncbi:hypothetical protein DFR55_10178 [Herbinix hemicellulosilytica]|uniref:Putative membrane protein n=1 Tax=Herbinix hemicellulosilytica TaxID=1564487 RepID=A0A0H5SHM3_HERHM|nr:hypothetical protein [Herbinix hemicellulosilytica]RBP60619.1 hypothetical protein DFR55_10178 [Herbinix hemicellulosilytica]CRZ34306.1 putative membrane protein [Herbinix hemicellulosilytica]
MSKKSNKKQMKAPMNKNTKILIYALAGILILCTIVLIAIENAPNRITVENKTDKKLEYVKAYFVDEEGPFTDPIQFDMIEQDSSNSFGLERQDFSYREANLEIRFKFEGYDELFVDAGYFNDIFKGKITISFTDEGENVLLHVKASNGILPNRNIDCNEEYLVNLEEGYVDN